MKKILLAFIILALVVTTSIFVFVFFKKQTNDRILAVGEEALDKLRCLDCNVILIGIDTLRADHLSSYGYHRDTSTNIDKFAENGVLFRNTFSASFSTTPSFMSMFTSLYPTDHGVSRSLFWSVRKTRPIVRINNEIKTLAEVLKENGYKTYGLVTSDQIPAELGFDRGFDSYHQYNLSEARERLLVLLSKISSEKFFIFYHDMEPHIPYVPPPPYDAVYPTSSFGKYLVNNYTMIGDFFGLVDGKNSTHILDLRSLYDGEIKHLDSFIGELQGVLKEHDLLQNTIIIFTADHGEEFYEHGRFNHGQFYNEVLRVPLIITWPKMDRKIDVNHAVRTVDIMPTILDFLSISAHHPIRGVSLLPYILDPSRQEELSALSAYGVGKGLEFSFIYNGNKIIKKASSIEFYDLASDPKEQNNLVENEYSGYKELENTLYEILNDNRYIYKPIPILFELDENRRENLKSLGY